MNQFNYEEELGNYLVGSDLLQNSWSAIWELPKQTPQRLPLSVTYKRSQNQEDVTIIAFGCSPICTVEHLQAEGKDLVSSATLKETFNFPHFDFLGTSFSIHRAAIQLYQSLHAQLVQEKIDITKPLIITGHSLGGSVASLFTLWLLHTSYSKRERTTKRPICLTFGSPLLGDDGLQETISGRPSWVSCFVNVVSKQDSVPGLFVSHHNAIVLSESSSETSSQYKPFGLYLLCSESGVACFSESELVFELLRAFSPQNMQFINYGLVLEGIKDKTIVVGTRLGGWDNNPLRTGIILQLQSIEIHEMQQSDDLIGRIEAKQKKSLDHQIYVLNLDEKLNKMKINMAHLEWYKKLTRSRGGYYDTYKSSFKGNEIQSRNAILKHKESLKKYWTKTVAEAKRTDGKSFPYRYLMSGNNYRRMVEPLDIADYYKNYKQDLKDYWAQGRSDHYILLEKWLEEIDPSIARKRKRACSFNEDSCFWVHVEEALILVKMLEDEEGCPENDEIFRKLRKFEEYVMDSINKLMLDPEIFLEGSSFMTWWSIYSNKKGTSNHSLLANYMKNGSYRTYS